MTLTLSYGDKSVVMLEKLVAYLPTEHAKMDTSGYVYPILDGIPPVLRNQLRTIQGEIAIMCNSLKLTTLLYQTYIGCKQLQ